MFDSSSNSEASYSLTAHELATISSVKQSGKAS